MSRSGKFIPGGRKDRDKGGPAAKGGEGAAEPIRAGAEGGGEEAKPTGRRALARGSTRFSRPVDKKTRPGITVVSIVFCFVFISIGWYYFAVLPAQEAAAKAAAEAARKAQELEDFKRQQEEEKKALAAKLAAQRATLVVATNPPGAKATLGSQTLLTPATFTDVMPGEHALTLELDGYATTTRELKLEGDKTLDLGTIDLPRKVGNLKLTTPLRNVQYEIKGPSGVNDRGILPRDFSRLPEGEYELIVEHRGWRLPPLKVMVVGDQDNTHEVVFPYATIRLQSDPSGANVREGGRIIGQTPLELAELRPGTRTLVVDKPGYQPGRIRFELEAGQTYDKDVALTKTKGFVTSFGLPMVLIPEGYYVGQTEVTQRQYMEVMGSNPSTFSGENFPVESVTYADAEKFCERATARERSRGTLPAGFRFALPTGSQWTDFLGDADINTAATSRRQTLSSTQPVYASEPNQFGIYDVLGNVGEWTRDEFRGKDTRSIRGGNWLSSQSTFPNPTAQSGAKVTYRDKFTGFRVIAIRE